MSWWQLVLIAGATSLSVVAAAGFLLWRSIPQATRALGLRLKRLSWRARLDLAWRLMREPRVPLPVRAIPVFVLVYLAVPIDIVPDFIPVLGQLDDVLILIVAVGLIARFVPARILDDLLTEVELPDAGDRGEGA